ncbi:MAG: hypothetical protein ACI85I_000815 [Arenicella sp.]|jgi:hypothetical protein
MRPISELEKAIQNLDVSTRELFQSLSKYNFTVELNVNGKDLGLAIGGGAIFDFFTLGMVIPFGILAAGLTSIIKLKASKTLSVEKASKKMKLNFLADANKKGILRE